MIGNKGTGFRSILSWAKSVHIRSEGLAVGFSQTRAENFLDELMEAELQREDKELIQGIEEATLGNEIKKYSREGRRPIAILCVPEWDEATTDPAPEFDTCIQVELGEGEFDEISEQMAAVGPEVMVFLNNLNEIRLEMPQKEVVLCRKVAQLEEGQHSVRIEESVNGKKTDPDYKWTVFWDRREKGCFRKEL